MKISIPNPCSEDFDKMTSTERGAFCKVCSTDTYDFRFMTGEQIIQIMEENKGNHICGRFNKSQLDDINSGFYQWQNQPPRLFQSKFLMACLLAFGLTLFSCDTEEKAAIESIQTEQILSDNNPQTAHINNNIDITDIDLLDYVAEPPALEKEIICESIIETNGGIEISGDIDIAPRVQEEYQLGGAIAYITETQIIEPIREEIDTAEEKILPDPIEIEQRLFEAKAFPNPTQGMSTVALDIKEEAQFDIMMFDMNGRMIRQIHSGMLTEGRKQFEVDMYELNSGMYIVKVISQGQDETLKIQKVN